MTELKLQHAHKGKYGERVEIWRGEEGQKVELAMIGTDHPLLKKKLAVRSVLDTSRYDGEDVFKILDEELRVTTTAYERALDNYMMHLVPYEEKVSGAGGEVMIKKFDPSTCLAEIEIWNKSQTRKIVTCSVSIDKSLVMDVSSDLFDELKRAYTKMRREFYTEAIPKRYKVGQYTELINS